jgi:hypothetical protein
MACLLGYLTIPARRAFARWPMAAGSKKNGPLSLCI